MLILVPILLLLLFAVGINLLGRYKLSTGSTWLMSAAAVLLVWISLILFRAHLQAGLTLTGWSPFTPGENQLVFNLSARTWVFAFLLVSLLVGVIFTDTIRFGRNNSLITWTGSMFLTAVGLFSIYSQTLLGIILSWTIIDVVEFGILMRLTKHVRVHYAVFLEFITRFFGTGLVVAALVLSGHQTAITDFSIISHNVYLLMIFGAASRLGVLPLHVPLTANLPIRRSLGTMLRFVAPFSVFSFLSQISPQPQYPGIVSFFVPIGLIIALYGAIRWVLEKNELSGRPFWMLAFSGLAIVSFVSGYTNTLISLCIMMIMCGGFAFLHSRGSRISLVLGALCLISITGFPFFPGASIWKFVTGITSLFSKILFMVTISLLYFGFLKKLVRNRTASSNPETWMKLFYFSGLGIFTAVPWITLIWNSGIFEEGGSWIVPAICLGSTAALFGLERTQIWKGISRLPLMQKLQIPFSMIGRFLGNIFKFEWFFVLLKKLFDLFSIPLKFFVNLLEGDGGLLWSFLFLALITSVIIAEIVP